MSRKGYYRWTGGDGRYWLEKHTYYYDGSLMSTEGSLPVCSEAKTVGRGGSWEYVGETPIEEPAAPRKEPIVYVCEVCSKDDPCHLVFMKTPGWPPNGCPFEPIGFHSADWHRRTDGE